MIHALAFILYAPLQSWGDIAVGEFRNTFRYPSKSALIGFLSAAMGWDKYRDEQLILALNRELKFAVRIDGDDTVLADYHTAQVPSNRKDEKYETRADEMRSSPLETIISHREYLCDAVYSIFCFGLMPKLERIKEKLVLPERPLYLGRISCPLALPCLPRIVAGRSLFEIQQQFGLEREIRERRWIPLREMGSLTRLVWEEGIEAGVDATKVIRRNDDLLSRTRWQFGMRSEYVGYVNMP